MTKQELLDFLKEYEEEHGKLPTRDSIREKGLEYQFSKEFGSFSEAKFYYLAKKDDETFEKKKPDNKDVLLEKLKNQLSEYEIKTILESSRFQEVEKKKFHTSLDKETFKFIAIGDTHIGHKKFREDWWNYMIDKGIEEEVDWMYHTGDIFEGMSNRPGHIYELSELGFEAQFNKTKSLFKDVPFQIKAITGNHDCLSEDTEILTDSGWKFYTDITDSDKILSLTEFGCKWDSINNIIVKPYNGKLINLKGNHIDKLCTPSHRVLHYKRLKSKTFTKMQYNIASDLNGRIRIPVSSCYNETCSNMNDNELRLLAWILTDGSCKNGKCEIYQSKDITPIVKILDELNIEYKIETRERNDILEICGKKLKNKPLPQNTIRFKYDLPDKYPFPLDECLKFNDKQFDIFLSSIIDGDGSRYKHTEKSWILYGVKKFLDQIQILCLLHNYRACINYDSRNNPRLNISKFNTTEFDVKTIKSEQYYNGKVWCLSVPETNFMVRRNGKHFFTGNCWYMGKGDQGIDVGSRLSESIDNFMYLGTQESDEYVGGIKVKLWHGLDGAAYANSWRTQKFIESLSSNDKPHILLAGHAHKSIYHTVREVCCFETGTLCEQTQFMRGKKLQAHTGFWIITVNTDGESITRLIPEWFPLFK